MTPCGLGPITASSLPRHCLVTVDGQGTTQLFAHRSSPVAAAPGRADTSRALAVWSGSHFVGTQVAQAGDHGLVEQHRFNGGAPTVERYRKKVGIDAQDVDSKMVKIGVK